MSATVYRPQMIETESASNNWDDFVTTHRYGHFLQTSAWGTLKGRHGWQGKHATIVSQPDGISSGGLILYRQLPFKIGKFAYVPRGPVVDWENVSHVHAVLAELKRSVTDAIALIIEPSIPNTPSDGQMLREQGFIPNPFTIQPPRTVLINLNVADETAILAKMKQKTRYNIGLARRKGVVIREATPDDLPKFYSMMEMTSERDKFAVHNQAYYSDFLQLFGNERATMNGERGMDAARLFVAEHTEIPGVLLAGAIVTAVANVGTYVYGASANEHRELMSSYLLQYEAMRWCRSRGCHTYDLWGIPDEDESTLEAEFEKRRDGLWGVYRFKRGFGGQVIRYIGTWVHIRSALRWRLFMFARKMRN